VLRPANQPTSVSAPTPAESPATIPAGAGTAASSPHASTRAPSRRVRRSALTVAVAFAGAILLAVTACGGGTPSPGAAATTPSTWQGILDKARGETVSLWMWGGDTRGNAYVDDVLTPAAKSLGVTLRRVPITDTKDAVNRILSERQAGSRNGSVDLLWVNGDNFATGVQAGIWRCGWTPTLPNMSYVKADDPLLMTDFGIPVNGCEVPWHKAQFTLVYNADKVTDPPHSFNGLLEWIRAHPGRFAYPAPPDFTGAVFVREVLYAVSGGYIHVPAHYDDTFFGSLTPLLWTTLKNLTPSLWRSGQTYPRDSVELDKLYADGQIDMTMTYGPATLTDLVAKGTFPRSTKVLSLDEGTVGNASFLAVPTTSAHWAGAMVVANLALSPHQQATKADPKVWGQFTVLDLDLIPPADRDAFTSLPTSPVVPPYQVLSRNANPELSAEWVSKLDDGWRRNVLGASG
jgi:putative spermidine/putrescine transport system substrate-binding protein